MKRMAASFCAAALVATTACSALAKGSGYTDINQSLWEYECVTELNDGGIIPDGEFFLGNSDDMRGNIANYFYNFYLKKGGEAKKDGEGPFTDLPLGYEYTQGCLWAAESAVIPAIIETEFGPYTAMSREELCGAIIRFADKMGIVLPKVNEFAPFRDSFEVSPKMQSYVAACQMAGIVSGGADGYFHPKNNVKKSECAAMIYRLYKIDGTGVPEGAQTVSTKDGEYTYFYEADIPMQGEAAVSASEAVDDSWFDNAVFIGDSVTEGLRLYRGNMIKGAKFVSAGSLSASNILSGQIKPVFQGKKVTPAEGVKLSGAKNVYIMLGMNNISFGIERATGDMVKVIDSILAENPTVNIIIESVTPMTKTSNKSGGKLNNTTIAQYNDAMRKICEERGWYFVNVSEGVCDAEGYLNAAYCSDGKAMGMHFNAAGVKAWIEYLKNHVPQELR